MKHIIQVLVENKFGILARVASLFSARGYNIDSLNVGETQDATISAMTIVVDAPDERILEQIKKISREAKEEGVISKLIKDNKLSVVANGGSDCILLACVDRQSEEEILRELKKIGIKELVRTGKAAIRK